MLAQRITDGFMLLDSFSSQFSILDSPTFAAFHRTITQLAMEKPEKPLQEVSAKKLPSRKKLVKMYQTMPLVIRGGLTDEAALKNWADPKWWRKNYGSEQVLCTSSTETGGYTMDEFFDSKGKLYVQGATALFENRPELKDQVESPITHQVAPGHEGAKPTYYQLFMGWKSQGSTVHCAIGLNVFRQVAGRKLWYFFPPSQTPYVYPKLYDNGFSCTSKTVQHHARGTGAPWFSRLERYQVILEPGDLLIVPPWWWHCVENLADEGDMVIGVATRYTDPVMALRNDPVKTLVAFAKARDVSRETEGDDHSSLEAALDFERKLMGNRNQTAQLLTLTPDEPPAPEATAPKRRRSSKPKVADPVD